MMRCVYIYVMCMFKVCGEQFSIDETSNDGGASESSGREVRDAHHVDDDGRRKCRIREVNEGRR